VDGFLYSFCTLGLGFPLPSIERNLVGLLKETTARNQVWIQRLVCLALQFVQNLLGKAQSDPRLLIGEAFNEDEHEPEVLNDPASFQFCPLYKMQLAYFFGDYKSAVQQSKLCAGIEDFASGHVVFTYASLFHALSAIALYRETGLGRRRAIRLARYHERKLKAKAFLMPSICSGKHLLLRGELAWVRGDHHSVFYEYSNSISCSASHGILVDQALASERLGRYMLERRDNEKASLYFHEAREIYAKWGATAKVEDLTMEMRKLNLAQIKPLISDHVEEEARAYTVDEME